MKKLLIFSLLALFFTCAFTVDAEAQRRGKKKKKKSSKTDQYFDESGNFLAKVWYGAGVNLNFSQGGFQGNSVSTFIFGLSPMAGYKISEQLSVGPRFEFAYQGSRISDGGTEDIKFNSVNLGLGAFTRFKINETYFIHGEYQFLNEENPTGVVNFQTKEFETLREWTANYYLGVGYTSGGLVGFEAYLLWNFAEEFTSNNIPLDYRFGLNYKF